MTTLYRPVLIESAEQAEALPEEIVLIRDGYYAFQKDKGRFVSTDPHDLPVAHAWEVVGWTALVPVEAEEETSQAISPEVGAFGSDDEIPEHYLGTPRTRYVTPWEEA